MINVFEHDATPTWSGFIYQGRIAVYLAIKTMIELRNEGKILEIDKYTIEMEKCEDIAIVYKDENGNRKYSSIHQVKNENKHTLSEYKKPLIQLMLEKGYYKECNAGAPDAYLHIANSIRGENKDFETECLKWKKEILKYYDAVDKACKNYTNNRKFYEELLNELKKEPIGIDRSEYKTQHSTVIKYCKEVVEENHTIDRIKFEEALKKLKDYLLNKLLVPYISSEVSIYKYDNGLNHFDGTKIFDGIVKLVKEYKGNIAGWSENQYKYLADKILNYIDKTILERHKNLQEKKCVVREISLSKLQEIMDTFVENNEKEANILALKRGYLESLDKFCQKCQEAMDDLQEACNTGRSYNTEHVNQALREVFHGKCYICENKEATSYQIEHLIPHRSDRKLKYDWNNLFWVCAHCNNIKSDKYEPILNCTTEPVEHLIAFRKTGYFGTDEKLEFSAVKDDNEAIRNTILLLNDAYYGTTPQKKMEARIIRRTLRKDLSKFKEYVREYQEAENEEEKEDIEMLLKRELKDSSAFTAFKRWLLWDNEEKYGELEKFIPENQKKN